MSNHHQDANRTPAPARSRRGPAFSLNPLPPRSSGSQFATPPRFQFPDEPRTGENKSTFRSRGPLVQGIFRAPDQKFDYSSPLKGERNKPVQVSDDDIEDDFDDTKDTAGLEDEAFRELDELFSISRRSNKRPRASSHSAHKPVRTEIIEDDFDRINDSSSPIPDSPSAPVRGRTKNPKLELLTPRIVPNRELVNIESSEPKGFEPISEPQTPDQGYSVQTEGVSSSIETSTFQNRPRFILSANYTPVSTTTPATSTPQPARKKPAFVLPRSPSPDKEDVSSSTIPAPFSPVATRTLRRPGRPKSGAAAAYLPGGMAEHLRDWIMEADMKRKAMTERQPRRNLNDARYSTIGRIESCHNAFLKSSGPVIMARLTPEASREEPPAANRSAQTMTVLLLGVAASRGNTNNDRGSSITSSDLGERLKPGDKVGIGAGLSWEIELDSTNINDTSHSKQVSGERVVPSSQSESEDGLEDLQEELQELAASSAHPTFSTSKTWLVAAEWDLLSETER